jgi:hypothetical protein
VELDDVELGFLQQLGVVPTADAVIAGQAIAG